MSSSLKRDCRLPLDRHWVSEGSKFRVNLVFDVLQDGRQLDEKMLAPFRPAVQDALAMLRATGAPRAAIMLGRRYLGQKLPDISQLKGPDRILAELLREQGCAPRVHNFAAVYDGVMIGEVLEVLAVRRKQ